ncbi:MAG: hypothetical protein MZU84_07980 [Sphingobacterium sp.]|nr:hypothetical protein [Sphingobacterium sp.]
MTGKNSFSHPTGRVLSEALTYTSAERDSADVWGPAVNLGPTINTEYNEDTPFLSDDDKTLYFSSAGHYNIGGYDIFFQLSKTMVAGLPRECGLPLEHYR